MQILNTGDGKSQENEHLGLTLLIPSSLTGVPKIDSTRSQRARDHPSTGEAGLAVHSENTQKVSPESPGSAKSFLVAVAATYVVTVQSVSSFSLSVFSCKLLSLIDPIMTKIDMVII